ncbi:MAG: FAD-dependent oxidoreductase [Nocardioidaceae bacterium]
MTRSYDLIVIGAGMAGVSAANKCASQGWTVAIVDALPYGGTCALRGCDPKKILRRGAEIIDSARLMRGKGIDDADLSINWADLMKHKHGFTDPVPQNMENSLIGNGIDTLHGVARFTDKNSIEIGGIHVRGDALPDRHRGTPTPAGLSRPRAPGRQHRLLGPGGAPAADLVRRWWLHLLRVRPHLGTCRQCPGHHRPRTASPQRVRPRPRRAPDHPRH